MKKKHNFVRLAEVQLAQGTLYCGGLDPHDFCSLEKNKKIYLHGSPNVDRWQMYYEILGLLGFSVGTIYDSPWNIKDGTERNRFAAFLAGVEEYIIRVIDILVNKCNIRVFKPQAAFFEQFGPMGNIMLARIRAHIKKIEKEKDIRLICLLDCKRGDIKTTQAMYLLGLLGNLKESWGIDYAPYDFDIINVTPWMGSDVMAFTDDNGGEGKGLKLVREGKGLIVVNKSSNPSGLEYQEMQIVGKEKTLQMCNVDDVYRMSLELELEYENLSALGLVVGSTHICDGSIRKAFPTTTLLVPGFGAQGGKFNKIMLELIRSGKWNGLGAIFSSSRGTMYPFIEKYGGSGKIENLENDLMKAISKFREAEEAAYSASEVVNAGIIYPFKKTA